MVISDREAVTFFKFELAFYGFTFLIQALFQNFFYFKAKSSQNLGNLIEQPISQLKVIIKSAF